MPATPAHNVVPTPNLIPLEYDKKVNEDLVHDRDVWTIVFEHISDYRLKSVLTNVCKFFRCLAYTTLTFFDFRLMNTRVPGKKLTVNILTSFKGTEGESKIVWFVSQIKTALRILQEFCPRLQTLIIDFRPLIAYHYRLYNQYIKKRKEHWKYTENDYRFPFWPEIIRLGETKSLKHLEIYFYTSILDLSFATSVTSCTLHRIGGRYGQKAESKMPPNCTSLRICFKEAWLNSSTIECPKNLKDFVFRDLTSGSPESSKIQTLEEIFHRQKDQLETLDIQAKFKLIKPEWIAGCSKLTTLTVDGPNLTDILSVIPSSVTTLCLFKFQPNFIPLIPPTVKTIDISAVNLAVKLVVDWDQYGSSFEFVFGPTEAQKLSSLPEKYQIQSPRRDDPLLLTARGCAGLPFHTLVFINDEVALSELSKKVPSYLFGCLFSEKILIKNSENPKFVTVNPHNRKTLSLIQYYLENILMDPYTSVPAEILQYLFRWKLVFNEKIK